MQPSVCKRVCVYIYTLIYVYVCLCMFLLFCFAMSTHKYINNHINTNICIYIYINIVHTVHTPDVCIKNMHLDAGTYIQYMYITTCCSFDLQQQQAKIFLLELLHLLYPADDPNASLAQFLAETPGNHVSSMVSCNPLLDNPMETLFVAWDFAR